MKHGMGIFAFLAILVAGTRVAVMPSTPQTTKTASSAGEYLPVEFKVTDFSCREFAEQPEAKDPARRGEIFTLLDRYLHGPSDTAKSEVAALPESIRFVIATVPDPLHTHLNLSFDRLIDAMQQAAQDDGYTYDSSWLPWKERAAEYSSREDKISEEKDAVSRQLCPGLIIFRRSIQPTAEHPNDDPYTQGLFLFLVAEKPTTGINRIQWNNALDWMNEHRGTENLDRALRVMGPTFSGSVPSIARALVDVGKQKHFTSVLLYTTIRSCSAYQWLSDGMHSDVPVRAADFNENDVTEIDRYFEYLRKQGHSLLEVAILSEDETAYGGLPDSHADEPTSGDDKQKLPSSTCDPGYPPDNRPLHLYYPRDISALRSAYREQSIFASTDTSSAAHVVLQPQASTSAHNDTDTVATFSGPNSALAQEAQMYGIVDSLRTHGIRFVILRGSNTLDYLFLARFLHRAYAGAFIVTMGPDLLFGREIDSTEFRGVAALTAFPLLPRGQDWTALTNPTPRHAHRVFGSATMEAAYLATRFLITDPTTHSGEERDYIHPIPPRADIPDYGPPIWESDRMKDSAGQPEPSRPSTWLSVVGRGGYWPLAVLNEPFTSDPKHSPLRSNLASVLAAKQNPTKQSDGEDTILKFYLSPAWKLCCVLTVLALALHFFASRSGYNYQNLSMFVQFMPLSGNRQLFLMSIGWAAIGSILILMSLCTLRIGMGPYLQRKDCLWIVILAISGIFAFLGAARDIGWRSCHDPGSPRIHLRPAIIWTALPLVLLVASIWAGLTIFDYSHPDGIPTALRAVNLTSGVSPMVSLLLLLSGFYWWFWQTLSGLALLGEGRPILPSAKRLPAGLARISDDMAKNIEEFAIPLPSIRIRRGIFYLLPLALLFLQACALWANSGLNPETLLHSLENNSFNLTLHAMLAIAFYVLVLECSQLLVTWLALQRLLLALNRTPLRRTFMALQGLSMNSLWNISGTSSRARYSIFSHQLESLHHLRNVLDCLDSRARGDEGIVEAVHTGCEQGRVFLAKRSTSADLAMISDEDGRLMREDFSRCTERILGGLIVNWCGDTGTLDLAENRDKGGSTAILPLSKDEPIRRAEEFVCLIYVGYLQNLLARMRTMVLSILGVFAAVAFSLAFYPYIPRPAIVLSLLCLLLVIGSVVALVYAGLARDETLSHITNTEPGALGLDFWLRLVSFIGVPAIGLIAAQFPGITDFLVSWIEPSLNAAK
jgi:hypothetical protein